MPKKGGQHNQNGDLYHMQYIDTKYQRHLSSSSSTASKMNADNRSPEERLELARFLSKLEGTDDPTNHVIRTSDEEATMSRKRVRTTLRRTF